MTMVPAPQEWFTGEVWFDELATPVEPSRVRVDTVRFAPGARTRWHHHPLGQVLHVTDGTLHVQRGQGPVEMIPAGGTVRIAAGEWHWHGAGPDASMTHIAIQEVADDGTEAEWGPAV